MLIASPLRRAVQTAEHVAARTGHDVIVDDELAEFDRHSHFYIPYEELKAEKDERWDDLIAGRWGTDGEVDPATFQAVVVEAVERVIAANPGRTVAIVCHGGVINAYLAHILGVDGPAGPMFFEPAYAGDLTGAWPRAPDSVSCARSTSTATSARSLSELGLIAP